MIAGLSALCVSADTTLVFGFDTTDSGSDVNGIEYGGVKQNITFTGAVSGSGTLFDLLDGQSGTVNFSIGAVGDLASLSGTIVSSGGAFNVGGYGAGVVGGASDNYIDDAGENWTFTFSSDVVLNAMRYYGGDAAGQSVLTNGNAVTGAPFGDDPNGLNIFVNAGDTLTFGDVGIDNGYALQDFTITVVPEPATLSMLTLSGGLLLVIRRTFC